jgi:hypothetical protein
MKEVMVLFVDWIDYAVPLHTLLPPSRSLRKHSLDDLRLHNLKLDLQTILIRYPTPLNKCK